jgi:hypothetical protein
MSYWGSRSDQNDYAFDSLSAYVLLIKKRMMDDLSNVIEKGYPEQSLIASLHCLRVIGMEFPESLSVAFRKKDLEKAETGFNRWYEAVAPKIPSNYQNDVLNEATNEFRLFKEFLGVKEKGAE